MNMEGSAPASISDEITEFIDQCEIYDYEVIDNKYFVGKYKVLFGFRIRGGRLFSGWCDFDVCCGRSETLLHLVKDLYIKKVKKNIKENKKFGSELLGSSEIKPIHNDIVYMKFLTELKAEIEGDEINGTGFK